MFVGTIFDSESGGVDTGDIPASLRFRSAASAYLSRTITTDATSTYFAAIKRGKLGVITPIFDTNIKFNANDTLTAFGLTTTAVFRDPTSWLFIHVSNGGLYVNGVSYGAVTTSSITNPRIGYDGTNYADMYVARIGVVGGSSSAYTNFGYQNTEINEWVSKTAAQVKAVVDAGGTNSFMLDFNNATSLTTLGYDYSSKGNNWTLNNFSLTAGTSYDRMLDVPGNSFATWNPLFPTTNTISNGNLRGALAASLNAGYGIRSSVAMVSGKYEAELIPAASADSWSYVGVCPATLGVSDVSVAGSNAVLYRAGNGNKNVSGSVSAYGASWTTEAIRIAVDMDARTVTFYKAGVSQGSISLPSSTEPYLFVMANGNATTFTADANFGQQPITLDAGYLALCQRNMPDPAILNPEKHFDVVTQLGSAVNTGANLLAQFTQFTADLAWGKDRAAVNNHQLVDTVRGSTAVLQSNTTAAETTYSAPTSGDNCVAWGWKAGGAAVTNNAGSISSQVSANVPAGFSIVTYTGNLSSAGTATVGHGLGQAPGLIISKSRNNAGGDSGQWVVRHRNLASVNHYLRLNTTDVPVDSSANGSMSASTSTVFSTNWTSGMNSNGGNFVAYCFAEIPGFSKIFSYTGNGSADGPFVHCGFKPKYVLIKRVDAAATWCVIDGVRNPSNVENLRLYPSAATAEETNTYLDATSNGFKVRVDSAEPTMNASGGTYIGIAFADVPAKYSLAR